MLFSKQKISYLQTTADVKCKREKKNIFFCLAVAMRKPTFDFLSILNKVGKKNYKTKVVL
jgi:hypothetical protein